MDPSPLPEKSTPKNSKLFKVKALYVLVRKDFTLKPTERT